MDITLKVKERGKNTIGLNGGVSGIAGSFVGLNYATNNFLGLGETLSINSQLGTRMRSVSTGFTEPYFLDRPLQIRREAHLTRFDFNQGREASILAGQNLIPLFNALGSAKPVELHPNRTRLFGFRELSVAAQFLAPGHHLRLRHLQRQDGNHRRHILLRLHQLQRHHRPQLADGIRTSRIVPSFTYNTVNHPINPTGGKSLFISTTFAGSFLGGNVNTIQPVIEGKYFKPAPWHRSAYPGVPPARRP